MDRAFGTAASNEPGEKLQATIKDIAPYPGLKPGAIIWTVPSALQLLTRTCPASQCIDEYTPRFYRYNDR